MKIAIAQINPVVGDISGNTARIADRIAAAESMGAELVVFGELSVTGYPPRDLLRKDRFIRDCQEAVEFLAGRCTRTSALVGFVRPTPSHSGRALQNAAALLSGGKIRHVYVKTLLPTYDVFDETRYFEPGGRQDLIDLFGTKIGLSICEDLWDSVALGRALYNVDPVAGLREQGAEIVINMAASPFQAGKAKLREELLCRQAQRCKCPILYVNQVGGNDELIFDGGSCAVNGDGHVVARAESFVEDIVLVDTQGTPGRCAAPLDDVAALAGAVRLGIKDYVCKCGFKSVVLGLSGGIDSAVVAVLAADALGPQNVLSLAMPSRFSSDHSLNDALELAKLNNIECKVVAIKAIHDAYDATVGQVYSGRWGSLAAENIQARIRGGIVMAYSNALGHLALATGNKSELSCGYCTLYGDMCGGLSPIGDILKTDVYRLAEYLNSSPCGVRIPISTIRKPPSAELKPNQVDQDKLPPYDLLDGILKLYVEQDMNASQIIAAGFDAKIVGEVIRMVDFSEYKRKQAPQVLKVTQRAFGSGRRMPVAQRYTGKEE